MAVKYDCTGCKKQVTATKNNRYRTHTDGTGEPCEMSSVEIPEHVLAAPVGKDDRPDVPREGIDFAKCPQCTRNVKLTRMGYFEPHNETLKGGERCPVSGVRAAHARPTQTVALPGDEPKSAAAAIPRVKAHTEAVQAGLADPRQTVVVHELPPAEDPGPEPGDGGPTAEVIPFPEPTSTPTDSPEPEPTSSTQETDSAPASRYGAASGAFLQPASPFLQPFEIPERIRLADSMSDRGKEVAARLKETFYAYVNRNSSDNRSAQRTLGPSEIGTPCDRQLAMKLLGITPTNPQEGWAPFVGTAVHRELADMFEWANGSGSGRYQVEIPVHFGSSLVPCGTLDLYDGVLYMVDDHKLMGRYSLDKLIQKGPSDTYRIQVQTYGLGAEQAGFKVREVAIIGWPRQESNLDKLYVHVEKYDKKVALDAIARVERLAREVQGRMATGAQPMEAARQFQGGDDCKWCPFHLKGDKKMERGCPGT